MLQVGDDATKISVATVEVAVGLKPVMAEIAQGGVVYRSSTSDFSLDASPSRDLDRLPTEPQGLVFSWSCTLFDGTLTAPCTDAQGTPLILASSPNVSISAGMLAVSDGAPYTLTVAVHDELLQKAVDAASILCYISQEPVLEVMIHFQSFDMALRGSQLLVNADDDVVLHATCDGAAPGQDIVWDMSPAPMVKSAWAFPSTDSHYLIVKGGSGALTRGTLYSFTAKCSTPYTLGTETRMIRGSAEFSVTINDAPSGGSCTACLKGTAPGICQQSGDKIFDQFRIACTRWADQDSPLQYRFGFSATGDERDALWGAFANSYYTDLVFPAGNISVFAQVQVTHTHTRSYTHTRSHTHQVIHTPAPSPSSPKSRSHTHIATTTTAHARTHKHACTQRLSEVAEQCGVPRHQVSAAAVLRNSHASMLLQPGIARSRWVLGH